MLYNGSMKLARLAALAWLRWIRLALFTVATLLWIASHGCMVAFLGSEFPPEKFWALYGKPACQYHILVFMSIGLFLVGCLIYAMEAFRRNSGWRRRGAMAGIVISMLGSLVAFVFAIRSAEKLSASGKVWQCLGKNAYPGVVKVLDYRYHCGTILQDRPYFKAWIEFEAGTTEDFTCESVSVALGDEKEALRMAKEAFWAFKPNSDGRVLAIRRDSKWEGWIVPGESPDQCVVIAWRFEGQFVNHP